MTDPPSIHTSDVEGAGRTGLLALACSLIAIAFALLAKDIFLTETGVSGFGVATIARESLFGVVVVVGMVLGYRGLSSPDLQRRAIALIAIALLAPFVGDALSYALMLLGASRARILFLAMSGMPVVLAMVLAWRTGGLASPVVHVSAAPPAVRKPPGPGTWIARIALVSFSLVSGLLICEGLFRWLGPRRLESPKLIVPGSEVTSLSRIAMIRPYGGPPAAEGLATRFPPRLFMKGWYDDPEWDYFDSQGCVDYVFNQHGLRDNDFDLEKKPGEYRIVAIGDSFTFGVGVQVEDIWTEVLERQLEAGREGPVEVINAGFVSGHRPDGYEKWLTTDGIRLQPDVVIVGLCLNDLHPGIALYAYRVVKPDSILGGRSRLLNHLRRQWMAQDPQPRNFFGKVRKDPSYRKATEAALLRTKQALDARGIRFIVAVFPMLSGLREEVYPYGRLIDLVIDYCGKVGIESIDLRDKFLGREDRTLWAHPTDQHPNDIGQRLIGTGIYEFLQQP